MCNWWGRWCGTCGFDDVELVGSTPSTMHPPILEMGFYEKSEYLFVNLIAILIFVYYCFLFSVSFRGFNLCLLCTSDWLNDVHLMSLPSITTIAIVSIQCNYCIYSTINKNTYCCPIYCAFFLRFITWILMHPEHNWNHSLKILSLSSAEWRHLAAGRSSCQNYSSDVRLRATAQVRPRSTAPLPCRLHIGIETIDWYLKKTRRRDMKNVRTSMVKRRSD